MTIEFGRQLHWGGVAEHSMRGGKMLPTLAVGWRASVMRG